MPRRPRILITRTRLQASALAARLEAYGAETILIPTIEMIAPSSFADLDAALPELASGFDWLIFTSANAVRCFAERASKLGIASCPKRIAAIGPATAIAVEEAGIAPQVAPVLVPPEYVAESLAASLLAVAMTPLNYLLVRAEEARDIIPEALRAAGHTVTVAAAYRNVTPESAVRALRELFAIEDQYPDLVTFTSSSTARHLINLLESLGQKIPRAVALASIGPVTSSTLRELGCEPTFEAEVPTIESLAVAIERHLRR